MGFISLIYNTPTIFIRFLKRLEETMTVETLRKKLNPTDQDGKHQMPELLRGFMNWDIF